jgi:hypothetical protein
MNLHKISFTAMLFTAGALASDTARPRVFITESHPLQLAGEGSVGDAEGTLTVTSGTTRENVEVMRNFSRYCPAVIVTANKDKADYVVRLDHEGANPSTPFVRGNKIAVFDKNEDLVFSHSTRFLSNAVKDVCKALTPKP